MFDHFIITRFNLRKEDWTLTKNNQVLLDESWMQERLELFKNFCLPSVVHQSNQNFRWLLYFDISTDSKFFNQIHEFEKLSSNIDCIFIDGMVSFMPSLKCI